MTFEELQEHIAEHNDQEGFSQVPTTGDENTDLIDSIIRDYPPHHDAEKYKQYNIANHAVMDKTIRKDKWKLVPTGEVDTKGNDKTRREKVKVNRIPIALQKQIVRTSAAFIVGGKVKLVGNFKPNTIEEQLFVAVNDTWRKNKLQFKLKQICKRRMSEMEVAVIWYKTEVKKKESMKMMIVSPVLGYTLYPMFDGAGDYIGFGYSFVANDGSITFVLFTDDYRIDYSKGKNASDWVVNEVTELDFNGKNPSVYFWQETVQWDDQQPAIERTETNRSNHGDTNDYNGSPMLKLKGNVKGVAAKGEAGKAFMMDKDADISYVTWDSAPESIKMENSDLRNDIFTTAGIPDLSPEFLKGLGAASGVAIDRIFTSAHLLARDEQEGDFGECVQRMINVIIAGHISMDATLAPAEDMEISAQYSLFRIDDESQKITDASTAVGGKAIMSRKTAVEYIGIVADVDQEVEAINAEEESLEEAVGGL